MSQEAATALTVLAPAMIVSLALLLASWRPWQREKLPRNGQWGTALALGAAFMAAFLVVAEWRGVQLKDRWHWMGPMVLAATVLGFTAALWRPNVFMRAVIAIVMAVSAALLLNLPPIVQNPMAWKIGFGAVAIVMWMNLEGLASRRSGAALPLALVIVFGGLSMVLLETHQAGFSLLAAAMSAACGVALIIALLNPHFSLASGGTYALATALGALITVGWVYNRSDVDVWPFAILLASPLVLWLAEAPLIAQRPSWQRMGVQILLATVPVGTAVLLAMRMTAAEAGDDYYPY